MPQIDESEHLRSGALVKLLPQFLAPPRLLNLLYVKRRNLSQRVRVVMDWLAVEIAQAQVRG